MPKLNPFVITLHVSALAALGGMAAYTAAQAPDLNQPATAAAVRLIGFGCGPKAQTLLAVEEDELPRCSAIEDVHGEACRVPLSDGQSVQLEPVECRDFWGDGY